ncbi:uncharacterized protein LOC141613781 [Silene latifolia]|uniref:uncharacterized protein LOC141613781 n=1 Tax=Silene latifolia TaxID=37657 RepID=UPI003D7788D4
MVVADLMNTTGSGWNTELLSSLFLPFECERIKNIRVSELKPDYTWYWVAEKDGIFSVKTAYRRLAGEKEALDFEGVSNGDNEKWLWKVPSLVSIYFVIVLLLNGFERVLIFPWTKKLIAGICVAGSRRGGGSMAVGNTRYLWWGCWALWEHRNSVIFYAKEVDPWGVVRRALEVVEEIEGGGFTRVIKRGEVGREGQIARKGWVRPQENFVKVNVDAGVKEGEGISVGVVCRNDRGEVVWGVSEVMEQHWEPQIAEAVDMLEGMKEAKRHRHRKIVVESDCLVLIDSLKKKKTERNMLALILEEILVLCNSFISVLWSYTSRANNGVAHALAHLFPRVVGRFLWSDVLPPTANNAVSIDSLLVMQ